MQSQAILILNQEEAIRDSLHLVLSDEGYQCFTARDKKDALWQLARQHFSIIILDSEFAVKTDIVKLINKQHPDIKSIVISSYATLETCRLALMKDADEFILKPLNFDELIAQIQKLLIPLSITGYF